MYIHRIIEKAILEKLRNDKILIILGPRQAGKTTTIKHLLNSGAKYLNLDLPADLNTFKAFSQLTPKEAKIFLENPEILVIDEAQREDQTSRIIKGFWDSGTKMKFVLLGSSSLDIKNQAAESLAGRNEKIYLMPFSFQEILSRKEWYKNGVQPADAILSAFASEIKVELMSSLAYGCYPECLFVADKQEFLSNLVEDHVFKDITALELVKSREPIYKLLQLLAGQIGNEVSVNELASQLGLARATVEKYIDLLEETFIVFRLSAFSRNSRKEVSKNKKIYFWDTGIRNAVLGEFSQNEWRAGLGQLWENWMVAEAAKQNLQAGGKAKLYFWRTHAGSEVDLIIKEGEKIRGFEIKWQKRKISSRAFESQYQSVVKLIDSSSPLVNFFGHRRA